MSKRNFRGRPKKPKKGGPAGRGSDMLAQIQQMQTDMAKAQEELANTTTTVTAGGGAVAIEITGHQRVVSIKISPDVLEIEAEDREMLEEMLVAGMNAAIEQSQTLSAQRMEGLTGGLGFDDLLGGIGDL